MSSFQSDGSNTTASNSCASDADLKLGPAALSLPANPLGQSKSQLPNESSLLYNPTRRHSAQEAQTVADATSPPYWMQRSHLVW